MFYVVLVECGSFAPLLTISARNTTESFDHSLELHPFFDGDRCLTLLLDLCYAKNLWNLGKCHFSSCTVARECERRHPMWSTQKNTNQMCVQLLCKFGPNAGWLASYSMCSTQISAGWEGIIYRCVTFPPTCASKSQEMGTVLAYTYWEPSMRLIKRTVQNGRPLNERETQTCGRVVRHVRLYFIGTVTAVY